MNKLLKKIARYNLEISRIVNLYSASPEREQFSIEELFVEPSLSKANGERIDARYLVKKDSRVIILGSPGSGKTTLLKFLALQFAKAFLDSNNSLCPIYIPAFKLGINREDDKLLRQISDITSENIGELNCQSSIEKALKEGLFVVLIDGLDEIVDSDYRLRFFSNLNDFSRRFPNLSIILTSRPAALTVPFRDFSYYHLEPFDFEQISRLSHKWFRDNPEHAKQFFQAVRSHKTLYALASNPLLLNLLWQVYSVRGALPTNLTSLYNDCTDYLLSTWERFKSIRRASISLHQKHEFLEHIAYDLLLKSQHHLNTNELIQYLEQYFVNYDFKSDDSTAIYNELLYSGILQEIGPGNITFIHRTFLEYYSARAISTDPLKVIGLIDKRELHDVVVMACGLLVDIAPILEAAVEKHEVLLAAKCVSHGRTKNKRLTEYVVSSFINEVGQSFIYQLMEFVHGDEFKEESYDTDSTLVDLWDRCFIEEITEQEKGKRFEEFSISFFSNLFKVVRHDFNTENGEIDLVCEFKAVDPFWSDFGGEVLVECKNWNSNVPLKEVGTFAYKVSTVRGLKLGFFVSGSGFTADAIRTLKNQAGDESKPLIVPIIGADIKKVLLQKDDIAEFFKESVRDMKFLRKY